MQFGKREQQSQSLAYSLFELIYVCRQCSIFYLFVISYTIDDLPLKKIPELKEEDHCNMCILGVLTYMATPHSEK